MSLKMALRMLSPALGVLLVASPALAAEVVRHAGSIVLENANHDIITIEEMGPWHGPSTEPVRREFHLTPRTVIQIAVRENRPGAFTGEFVERPLGRGDLRRGDFATVTVQREGGQDQVTSIMVVRPTDRAGASEKGAALRADPRVPVGGRSSTRT
jgi:hypothetical protein